MNIQTAIIPVNSTLCPTCQSDDVYENFDKEGKPKNTMTCSECGHVSHFIDFKFRTYLERQQEKHKVRRKKWAADAQKIKIKLIVHEPEQKILPPHAPVFEEITAVDESEAIQFIKIDSIQRWCLTVEWQAGKHRTFANTVGMSEFMSVGKRTHVAFVRQIAMYLSRKLSGHSFPAIAKKFKRDHSSVIYAHQKIAGMIKNRELFANGELFPFEAYEVD